MHHRPMESLGVVVISSSQTGWQRLVRELCGDMAPIIPFASGLDQNEEEVSYGQDDSTTPDMTIDGKR